MYTSINHFCRKIYDLTHCKFRSTTFCRKKCNRYCTLQLTTYLSKFITKNRKIYNQTYCALQFTTSVRRPITRKRTIYNQTYCTLNIIISTSSLLQGILIQVCTRNPYIGLYKESLICIIVEINQVILFLLFNSLQKFIKYRYTTKTRCMHH